MPDSPEQVAEKLASIASGQEDVVQDPEQLQNQMIQLWLMFFISVTHKMPVTVSNIELHGGPTRLYIRSHYKVPNAAAVNGFDEVKKDMVMHNVVNFAFTPASGIELPMPVGTDVFQEEWPPSQLIAEHHKLDKAMMKKAKESESRIQIADATALNGIPKPAVGGRRTTTPRR